MKHKAKYKLLMQQLSEALDTFVFSNQQKDELFFFSLSIDELIG